MLRVVILAFLLILVIKPLQAQNWPSQQNTATITVSPDAEVNLGTSFWAAAGAGFADTTNPEALLYNPALPLSYKHLIISGGILHSGMEIGYSFEDPIAPVKVSIEPQFLDPNYLMAASRYHSFLFQGGYRLLYSTQLKYEQDFILNNVHYFGTSYETDNVHELFVGINRAMNHQLSIGAQAGIAFLTASVRNRDDLLASAVGNGFHFRLGLLYQPVNAFSLALTYRHLSSIDYQYSIKKVALLTPDSRKYTLTFPDFYALGMTLLPNPEVNISLRIRYEYYSESHSDNRLQIGAGIRFNLPKKWALDIGAFTLGDLPGSNHFEDVIFLTTGLSRFILPNIKFELSGLTSHFTSDFSDVTRQFDQTRILFGMQLYLKN